EGALGHLARVHHAHRAGGGVAGVGEGLEPLGLALGVQRVVVAPVDDDLAAQGDLALVGDAQGNAADGADVLGDVLADLSVAASARLDHAPALVHHLHAGP